MKHNSDLSQDESINKVGELIKDIKFAMLSTHAHDGHIHSRPMTTQAEEDFDGTIWFFLSKDSEIKKQIDANPHVNLAYANPDDNSYVSVCGTGSFTNDEVMKRDLWKPAYKAWFSEGVDDPNLILLKIDAISAEYWDTPSTLAYGLNLVKSVITGEKDNDGKFHQKINLN